MTEVGSNREVVGRLAPSPTGHLHLGHARSFLIAWWHARQRGGRVVLRLEDLDQDRSAQSYVDSTLTDLEWLGLDWDGKVERQSERVEVIRAQALMLQARGLAYWCVCSRGDIQARSAPHGPELAALYPKTCDGRFASLSEAEASGKPAGLRFRVDRQTISFHDTFCGRYGQDLTLTSGDFLLLRRDKVPAYQLAVVVDDAAQGVTEVIRGDDLLDSTPRQIALLHALGLPLPSYTHLPLVLDASGKRLAKRHASLSLRTLRESGVEATALIQFVLKTCGVTAEARLTASEAIPKFQMCNLPRVPVRIDDTSLIAQLTR